MEIYDLFLFSVVCTDAQKYGIDFNFHNFGTFFLHFSAWQLINHSENMAIEDFIAS